MTSSKISQKSYSVNILEEYKLISSEKQWMISKWLQGIALYIATFAFSMRELGLADRLGLVISAFLFCTALNVLGFFVSLSCRRTVEHIQNRERELADKLRFRIPISLLWGHTVAASFIFAMQVLAIGLLLLKVA